MAHMIDQSTGRDAIAFVGQTPWHGLGKQLTAGADIETWRREAGLDYKVERTPVKFAIAGSDAINDFPDRDVLYRDDTRSPISVVSKWYNVVQPGEILGFFEQLTEHNGFTLETAGALDGGRRVWALARVNDGAPILDADVIRPYVLLGHELRLEPVDDGEVHVRPRRLPQHADHEHGLRRRGAVGERLRRLLHPHPALGQVRRQRCTARSRHRVRRVGALPRHHPQARAHRRSTTTFAREFLKQLLPAPTTAIAGKIARPVEETKAFKSIIGLFEGCAIGSDLPEAKGTAYGLLNAVTEYVDHQRGGDLTRLSSAWFGSGEGLKNEAFALLEKVAA